jgi:hypothetical protein
VGAATGVMRRVIQSAPAVDQAPAGIVAEAKPSDDVTVVPAEVVVFASTGGAGEPEVDDQTVKWTWKAPFLPAES